MRSFGAMRSPFFGATIPFESDSAMQSDLPGEGDSSMQSDISFLTRSIANATTAMQSDLLLLTR